MRTMLILLILICSLAQLAWTDNSVGNDPQTIPPDGCGTTYDCYAPESCTDINQRAKELDQVSIVEVTKPVLIDCTAIIRFHQYTRHRVHVVIESYLDISQITSIKFLQKHTSNWGTSEFSCSNNNNKMEGTFEELSPSIAPGSFVSSVKQLEENPSTKLKCTFEISKKDPFKGHRFDDLTFSTTGSIAKTTIISTRIPILDTLRCDPSDFEYDIDDINDERIYKEIKYRPGEYFCEEPKLYIMEYRLFGDDKYKKVTNDLTCNRDRFFVINGNPTAKIGDTIKIRCVADAKFFCNYPVKGKTGEPKLLKTPPDLDAKHGTSLKCPDGTPHLMIEKRAKPIVDPVFTCHNFGGERMWTVNVPGTGDIQLTEQGPTVHCTKKLPCDLFHPISGKAVEKGFVSSKDFKPKCFEESGILLIGGKDGKKVESVECDYETGRFMCVAGGEKKPVDDDTKFFCHYPRIISKAKDAEKVKAIKAYAGIVGAVVGVIVFLIITVFTAWTLWSFMKERRKRKEVDDADFYFYCGNEVEKKAYKKAKEERLKKKGKTEPVAEVESKWNAQITSFRYTTMNDFASEDGVVESEEKKTVIKLTKPKVRKLKVPKVAELGKNLEELKKNLNEMEILAIPIVMEMEQLVARKGVKGNIVTCNEKARNYNEKATKAAEKLKKMQQQPQQPQQTPQLEQTQQATQPQQPQQK